jgi:hypothetical protein
MDENNQPIVYVLDTRNAGPNDHRVGGGGFWNNLPVPGRTPAPAPVPVGALRPATMVAPAYRPSAVYVQQPAYVQPAPFAGSSLFGNLTKGEVVDLIIQGLVALTPLPAAPVATGDVGTDVQNHVLYQGALALHAKRDEQLRTLAYGVRKLLA